MRWVRDLLERLPRQRAWDRIHPEWGKGQRFPERVDIARRFLLMRGLTVRHPDLVRDSLALPLVRVRR